MSLTGSRTLIRRSAEQWQEILQRFEHSGQTQPAFCAAECYQRRDYVGISPV